MKQAIKTTRMITMGILTLCAIGLSKGTFAGIKTDDPIEFKFIGKIKNYPVFELNLNNSEAEQYLIKIKDENNDELYSERVNAKDVNFSRRYGLDIEDLDLNAPGFSVIVEVTSRKTKKTQVYKISSHRNVTQDIIVATL